MRISAITGILLVTFMGGCAGSRSAQTASLLEPEIAIAQLPGTSFVMEYRGPLSIGYAIEIRNQSSEPIELKSVQLQTLGSSPYRLQRAIVPVKATIPPNGADIVQFSASAYSYGGRFAPTEPVMIRGIAHFDSPQGQFQTVFTQRVLQPDDSRSE